MIRTIAIIENTIGKGNIHDPVVSRVKVVEDDDVDEEVADVDFEDFTVLRSVVLVFPTLRCRNPSDMMMCRYKKYKIKYVIHGGERMFESEKFRPPTEHNFFL